MCCSSQVFEHICWKYLFSIYLYCGNWMLWVWNGGILYWNMICVQFPGDLSAQCHYCTHYSSAIIVASYLVRMEPFTQTFCSLQVRGQDNFPPTPCYEPCSALPWLCNEGELVFLTFYGLYLWNWGNIYAMNVEFSENILRGALMWGRRII